MSVVLFQTEPTNPKKFYMLDRTVACIRACVQNFGMENTKYTSIPKRVAGFWRNNHHIGMGSWVCCVLTTAHIISGVVDAEHF